MRLSYRELEDFIAELHAVAPSKRTALKGRLKHFQRLGWPAGTNQGKGARVQYDIGQTLFLAVGMEMLQLGITPERVVEHFNENPDSGVGLAYSFMDALDAGPGEPIYYVFNPEALSHLRGSVLSGGTHHMVVPHAKGHELFEAGSSLRHWRRFSFIDLTEILDRCARHFSERFPDREGLRKPLTAWFVAEGGIDTSGTS